MASTAGSRTCGPSWTATWPSSGPSSAGSGGRSPATRSTTCSRRTDSTSPARWSGPRARSAWSPRSPCGWWPSRRSACWSSLGFEDIVAAAEATPAVLEHGPTACEGLDARIVDVVRRRRGAAAVPELPRGAAWLLVELPVASRAEVLARAGELSRHVDALEARVIDDAGESAALWRIREDGAGLAGRAPSGAPAWSGWEDAAVPPTALAAYLGEFEQLVGEHGLTAHAVRALRGRLRAHPRSTSRSGAERRGPDAATSSSRPPSLSSATAAPCRASTATDGHGASCCRSCTRRGAMRVMAAVKHVFDPDRVLNPGVLVEPAPSRRVRCGSPPSLPRLRQVGFAYAEDGGDFAEAVHRCTGVGRCRVTTAAAGTVMCPSYVATREEKDSTRGRARVLQEMVNGQLSTAGAAQRSTTPSTCACPARDAPRTARRASTWRPGSPRCCTRPTGDACVRSRTTRWAGCPGGLGWRAARRPWRTG